MNTMNPKFDAFMTAQELLGLARERSAADLDRDLLSWVDDEIAALTPTQADAVLVAFNRMTVGRQCW